MMSTATMWDSIHERRDVQNIENVLRKMVVPLAETEDQMALGYRLALGDEVLITGVSGSFPDSDSVLKLQENLFNKVDLVTSDDRRWKFDPDIPHRTGKINNVNKFDASFFGVHYKQAQAMDPMCRILLEKTYEAVYDAGVNPKELRHTKTGVFIGTCFTESEATWIYERENLNQYGLIGCSRAMLANRISYWLGVNGPSYAVDSACSSSLSALEHAFRAIRDGHCDSAIVGGSNLCLHPHFSLLLAKMGVLSPDGLNKSFDDSANGYVRAEAIVVIFLQKAKNSRRVYSQIIHAKISSDGYKEQGITHLSQTSQEQILREFYDECNVPPQMVDYVEAHGTGTSVGDLIELTAIDRIFCTGRSEPLQIGSIKSNLGHAEPASGLVSIAKMCIAYSTGYIPPNLHYQTPRKEIAALSENRLQVVTEKTSWNKTFAAINSFGFGGSNAHVLLKNVTKKKINNGLPSDDLPRLVCVSGRTKSAVTKILDDLESRPLDVEFVKLLHSIHDVDIHGHVFRGYSLLVSTTEKAVPLTQSVQHFPGVRRPVWFVYSGMGSQWPGMGAQLMRIPVFAAAIHKCHKVLEPKGIDVIAIIREPDPKIYDNVLNSFIGIVAVQIGLTDVLKSIGIEPDNIIGHSLGELGCAYADRCFTTEQTILAAYSRGLACNEIPLIKGSMAAVGIGYNKMKSMCPPEIEVACHNSTDSSTISGPADVLKIFITKLSAQGIFVKEVSCGNIAFHSKYITDAGPTLLKYLKEMIPNPKPRSKKWLSTSVPQSLWKDPEYALCSAEYHANNLLNPVLFEETSRHIQHNAITIEVAPHGLLQAILKRSLQKDVFKSQLTQRDKKDSIEFLFNALGKLYEAGLNPHLAALYPAVPFPVSQGTPMLSHLVEWDHSEDWFVTSYESEDKKNCIERTIKMSFDDEKNKFLTQHIIGGDNVYPESGYLMLVWETLAKNLGHKYNELSVLFENVHFRRTTVIPKDGNLEFVVIINKNSRNFEVLESGVTIATGSIYPKNNTTQEYYKEPTITDIIDTNIQKLLTKDIYKEFRIRRYQYGALFRGIQECNIQCTRGRINWFNNWVTFINSMMQLKIIGTDTRHILIPSRIEKIFIDTALHFSDISIMESENKSCFEVFVDYDVDITRAGGVEIRGYHLNQITKHIDLDNPVLESNVFVPNFGENKINIEDILRIYIQLVVENLLTYQIKVMELYDQEYKHNQFKPILKTVETIIDKINIVQAEMILLSEEFIEIPQNITVRTKELQDEECVILFIGVSLLGRPDVLQQVKITSRRKCFIISREKSRPDPKQYSHKYDIICIHDTGDHYLVLFRKRVTTSPIQSAKFINIKTSDQTFGWIDNVKTHLEEGKKLYLYSQDEPINGLLGLVNCLRKEPGGDIVYGLLIADSSVPVFDLELDFYKDQLEKDLAINVYQNGKWGTYRHLLLEDLKTVRTKHAYVNTMTVGDLSSLIWLEGPLMVDHILKETEGILIQVYYASLNNRDLMAALGHVTLDGLTRNRLMQEYTLGFEVSGKTQEGAHVMGIVKQQGLSNLVEGQKSLLWDIPNKWSFGEAATVPVAYSTVYYALVMVGQMQRGESILIHAGSGGVGQAAINVALHYGCEIFTTVGTAEKRDFIKTLFPDIKDNHIGNSHEQSFADMIRRETKGKGVDIVLNSFEGDEFQISIRCLNRQGRYLDLTKVGNLDKTALEISSILKDISYHKITMDFSQLSTELKKKLQVLVKTGIETGVVRPLTYHIFETHEVKAAFRFMEANRHNGKVIIKIRDDDDDTSKNSVDPASIAIDAVPRYHCDENQVHIIVGGLGGFGLELADWLILRGARKIVLVSRRGVVNGYQAYRLRTWACCHANVQISTDDVATEEGCVSMLETANAIGMVGAIFNLALVLKDSLFQNQTPESFRIACKPKALATIYLDKLSRKMCPQLKSFVVFSSVTCGRGNAGQTNYGFSNSVMERICEERKKLGLPALAVQWGPIGDVGVLADNQEEYTQIVLEGCRQQSISSCLTILDKFLKQEATIVTSVVVAEKVKIKETDAKTAVDAIAKIMGIKDVKMVANQMSLAELGMDSMMTVEIKQTLEREFKIYLTSPNIRTLTLARLAELSKQKEAICPVFSHDNTEETPVKECCQ